MLIDEIMNLKAIHHVAVICTHYGRSKHFYVEVLGLKILAENYRELRKSYKLDLELPDGGQLELFSFPDVPERSSYPEAAGLRHLAFRVDNLDKALKHLEKNCIFFEPVRIDENTGNRFTFFTDPDGLPLELYEVDES